jgi:hypothetical protein
MRAARSSDARPYRAEIWRVVEAQNKSSTTRLTDSLADQRILEDLIEEAKPDVPANCRHLHYLLYTPFRHKPYPHSSRFRRANSYPGVFYGAESQKTAVAETAFYRMLFFHEASGASLPPSSVQHHTFAVPCATGSTFDLTAPPFEEEQAAWTHPTDYGRCLALADEARSLGIEAIRYESVRHPGGRNVAILDPAAFASSSPTRIETWHIFVRPTVVQAWREFPFLQLEFDLSDFAADSRVSKIIVQRRFAPRES